jgi:hypothetical protein
MSGRRRLGARVGLVAALLASLVPAASFAQSRVERAADKAAETAEKAAQTAGKAAQTAGGIASQPAKDVGLVKTEIPPLLIEAAAAPYDLKGLSGCGDLAAEVGRLSEVLGPDLDTPTEVADRSPERVATAGGRAVVNSLIPFRGLVREVSGAAAEQRARNAAIDAGYARRGFLRGVHQARNCRPALSASTPPPPASR